MNLGKLFCAIILFVPTVFSTLACADNSGVVIFGRASELVKLDLLSKRLDTLSVSGLRQCGNPNMTKLDNRNLLIEATCGGRGGIFKLDLNTNLASFVTDGYDPTYIASGRKIFYIKSIDSGKQLPLFVADYDNIQDTEKVVVNESFSGGVYVIPISSDEILFYKRISEKIVWRFNVLNSALNEVHLGCTPLAWRSATKELLCFDPERKHVVLTDLLRQHTQALPELDRANPVLYIDQLDALVFDTSAYNYFPPERRDLAIYYFKTHKIEVLLKGVALNWGAAVYLEK
jgi:hypothetical protein